uniref:Rubisco LSMT substrate-binding domain-containing protein n=1 Tax=Oryza meridionalis TaxID=40149 RepID=A0A0E0EBS9_9ORYZ
MPKPQSGRRLSDIPAATMAAAAAEVAAAGGGGEMVVVRLPPLSEDDPLFQDKKRILDSRNLSCLFQVPNSCSAADAFKVLDRMIQAARIAHMDELELYFTGDEDFGPLSTRNELESLNLLLKILNTLLLTANVGAMGVLQVLCDEILLRLRSLELEDNGQMVVQIRNQNMEDSLLKWGEQHGAGRGMVASENIDVGDIALEIPESSIISEELLCQSDMFLALKDLDSITTETMLLLWSIRERYSPSSKFKIYFEALPANFNTGLSFGIDALAALEGTLLFDERQFISVRNYKPNQSYGTWDMAVQIKRTSDNKENDRMVLETLLSIFTPMLEGLGEPDDFDRENACWDVKLALDYKDLQRRIVLSIVTSCTSGLAMLDS